MEEVEYSSFHFDLQKTKRYWHPHSRVYACN